MSYNPYTTEFEYDVEANRNGTGQTLHAFYGCAYGEDCDRFEQFCSEQWFDYWVSNSGITDDGVKWGAYHFHTYHKPSAMMFKLTWGGVQ